MFDLLCKIAIVTGGANGIGAQTVQVFLDEGAKFVAFLDIDKQAGLLLEEELQAKYGINRVKFFYGDVTNDNDLSEIFNYTIKNYGYIDLLVNNAGISRDDLYKREIDVNFENCFRFKMMFDLVDKVVLITGASNGIGAAAVRKFLEEGAKFVAFLDVDEENGILLEKELITTYGEDKLKFFNCDVTKDEELFKVYNYAVEKHGYIDLVVNNAGIADDAMHKKEIQINFTSLVTSSLKALDLMRKDKGGKGGTIINISSMVALYLPSHPVIFVYWATKSAVLMFSKNLGVDTYYAHTGVRVVTLCFGATTTNIIPNSRGIDDISIEAMLKMMSTQVKQTPEAAAEGIIEVFKKGKTGSVWIVCESKTMDISERVSNAYKVMSGQIII